MRVHRFLGMWVTLAFVVGLTIVANDRLDLGGDAGDQVVSGPDATQVPPATGTTTTGATAVVPGPGQVRVTGTVRAVHLEGAVLDPREVAAPLTIVSDRGFGNGGELTQVLVEGAPSSVVWDGGRPFVLSSGVALVLDPATVDLVAEGLRLRLGGGNHRLLPGTYRLDTPVAVGSRGIATPRDTVTFEAGDNSLFEARGDASLLLGPDAARHVLGPGRVQLEGALELTDGAGTRSAPALAADLAAFDLTFSPTGDGGWRVEGLVEERAPG